ncbi:hypothetical protein [Streptomyces yanii]|uniref:Uncharacterized protein n=1 Tax=Streptomyces yanii TaxID=78510 RepID=A0ABV5R7Z7_9ACTN
MSLTRDQDVIEGLTADDAGHASNRFMGMLFFRLQHHQPYDESKAFPHQPPTEELTAAA